MRHKILTSASSFPDEFYLEIYEKSLIEIEHFKQIYGPNDKRWRWFIDAKSVLLQPKYCKPIAKLFALAAEKMGADYVATMGYGAAAFIGSIITYSDKLGGLIVRSSEKEYGNDRDIIGDVPEGKKIVVIDDLINSGDSILKMKNILHKEGAETIGALSVFEFADGRGRKRLDNENIRLVSLAKLEPIGNSLPKAMPIVVRPEIQELDQL